MALLKAIPADATAFIAIPSLHLLDTHVQSMLQQLQLAGMVPGPLDLIRRYAKLGKGLDENGSLAIVLMSLREAKTPNDIGDRLVLFIPTTNADQLLASLGGEKEGDITKVRLMDAPSVAVATDGFIIAAEKADTLKAALKAPKKGIDAVMAPDRLKAYAGNDLFGWADPSSLSKELKDQVRDAIKDAMGKMNPAAPNTPNASAAQLEKMLDELKEVSLGISADSKKGIAINWYGSPKPGTDLAKQAESIKGKDGSLLAGLPKEPVIAAMGWIGPDQPQTAQIEQGINQAFSMITSGLESSGVKLDADRLKAIKDLIVSLASSVQGTSMSIAGLPAEGGEGRLGLVMSLKVKDGAKCQADARKLFGNVKQLIVDTLKKQGEPDDKINPIADAIDLKAKAETVDGATVDHFVVDLDKLPIPEEGKADLAKVKAFIGKEGILIRIASTADNHLVITFGGGAKRFAEVLEATKKGDASLADLAGIKAVANRLPKGPRLMEGYLALDNLLDFVMSTAAQFGQPIPMPLALRNAAPIVLTCTKVSSIAAESELLIPMELITSVKDLVGPIMMMMSGGGGAPGGAPPPGSKGELN
jgi:hypothetical protein